MNLKNWNIEEFTGYKPKTTFYTDLSIADKFGIESVIDTFNNVFKSWNTDVEYFTEFVMALNWKIWEHYNSNKELAKTYNDLWENAENYIFNNWSEEDQSYYIRTTD